MDIETQLVSFMAEHARELHWLQKDAHGIWNQDDMQGELYLALVELSTEGGHTPDLRDAETAQAVLRHLRRKADRQGRTFRNASRLDYAPPRQMLLIDRMVADEGRHPLSLLEASENLEREFDVPMPEHSQLAAWHHLVERFDRKIRLLAEYLLISPSWCARCRRRVRRQVVVQWPLPHPRHATRPDALRRWRCFKLPSRHPHDGSQLKLDYWARPTQPSTGQLRLL